jgi:hypothetical protein
MNAPVLSESMCLVEKAKIGIHNNQPSASRKQIIEPMNMKAVPAICHFAPKTLGFSGSITFVQSRLCFLQVSTQKQTVKLPHTCFIFTVATPFRL